MYERQKKIETTARHPKNRNIPGIKSAKKKVLITKTKSEMGEIITSRKGIANYKKIYDDNEQDETEQEIGENENSKQH